MIPVAETEGALGREEEFVALKRLDDQVRRLEDRANGLSFGRRSITSGGLPRMAAVSFTDASRRFGRTALGQRRGRRIARQDPLSGGRHIERCETLEDRVDYDLRRGHAAS
jgi:hypothetical protein